ncbi:MAG: DNA-3-methyladenine glycosylase [bacterium]
MEDLGLLGRDFYTQPAIKVAKDLLGTFVVRKWRGKEIVGKIVETEVYPDTNDKASHSYLGRRTTRNEAEYLIGGHVYIYLVYGMYWQFNITTGLAEMPECVLIRALEPLTKENCANGPGKLCQYLKLNKSFYAEDLTASARIWLLPQKEIIKPARIVATKRIGIDYAGTYWANRKWRYYLKDNNFVSKK